MWLLLGFGESTIASICQVIYALAPLTNCMVIYYYPKGFSLRNFEDWDCVYYFLLKHCVGFEVVFWLLPSSVRSDERKVSVSFFLRFR